MQLPAALRFFPRSIDQARRIYSELNRRNAHHRCAKSKGQPEAHLRVLAIRDKILYCDYLDNDLVSVSYVNRRIRDLRDRRQEKKDHIANHLEKPVYSVLAQEVRDSKEGGEERAASKDSGPVIMPYALTDKFERLIPEADRKEDEEVEPKNGSLNATYKRLYEKYLQLKEAAAENKKIPFEDYVRDQTRSTKPADDFSKIPPNWMTDYEQYDDGMERPEALGLYGTPNPQSKASTVPCSGCGAMLHCRDPAIPGYLPSELYMHVPHEDLKIMICQRCHLLRHYNTALDVNVSAEDYPELLRVIKRKRCAVILMIDLTDFPCSIWSEIETILHPNTPVYLIGNKLDVLPRDRSDFLPHLCYRLKDAVIDATGMKPERIAHVAVISAKTHYGVESLINKLHTKWNSTGDIYLIGCTNVGKSSLFNTLVNSDYCKTQAIDLVRRATISPWPGTTLNMLKFPILKLTKSKAFERTKRLIEESKYHAAEIVHRREQYNKTKRVQFATYQEHVGRTFRITSHKPVNDYFADQSSLESSRIVGLDDTKIEYKDSHWCYDTPGTIHPDQVLDLLTTDELLATLPQKIISPRSFIFKPQQTMFLAGLGRLDYTAGDDFIRCTLFASEMLPVTMCNTIDAEVVYEELLNTDAFVVPTNDPERLKLWPRLESKQFKMTGINEEESAADVVLSSSGWIAVTPNENKTVTLTAWTPQGRGLYIRYPALIGRSVALRGKRIQNTPMYKSGRMIYTKR